MPPDPQDPTTENNLPDDPLQRLVKLIQLLLQKVLVATQISSVIIFAVILAVLGLLMLFFRIFPPHITP